MQIEHTALPDVLVITPARFGDARGWFSETWNAPKLAAAGIGLHFQSPPRAQDKLVRCSRGAIRDVAVDVRRGSPHYGKWVAVDLTEENARQLLVPKGFLHGFVTLMPDTEVQYKCTDVYAPECDGGIRWNDPEIGIDWGVADPVLSAKDQIAPFLRDWTSPFVWEGAL